MSRYTYINIKAALIALLLSVAIDSSAQALDGALRQASSNSNKSQSNGDDDEEDKYTPKIIVLKDQGLSLGIDLSPFIMRIIKEENTGFAFVGRMGFKTRWWANGEVGFQNTKYSNQNFKYKANGAFIKIGVDYDIFMSEYFPVNDNIFVGARYGYSWQSHEAENFSIVDSYWGNYDGSVGNSAVNSHIIEILFGLRCEVLKNFYMGWSVRGRFLLASFHDSSLDPYAIAGYGNYDTKAGIGFTYTLEYQIPFNKLKKNKQLHRDATTIELTNKKE